MNRPRIHGRIIGRYPPMARWTDRAALRRTKHRCWDARAALADIEMTWGDVDQYIVDEAAELEEHIVERIAAGEEIGP